MIILLTEERFQKNNYEHKIKCDSLQTFIIIFVYKFEKVILSLLVDEV